jgi:L-threonylcarbamoyladenylate synthase
VDTQISLATHLLRQGQLVAFPTETVYGLGADATNPNAIEKIFAAKGRPSTNPLIVHIADANIARQFAAAWPAIADKLAEHFWPGPLTLVLPKSPRIVDQVTAGRPTVGLRVPNHPLALDLLRSFAGAVAAPSANRSNHISPTSAADVKAELGDRVDLILDGGPCTVGIESTVLDLTTKIPTILRPGGVTREQIQSIIGPVNQFTGSIDTAAAASSPGQHARHYSPRTPTFRFEPAQRSRAVKLTGVFICLNPTASKNAVTLPNNPTEYARVLYQTLRSVDQQNPAAIYIEMPPDQPAWHAIRDRLIRASLPLSL